MLQTFEKVIAKAKLFAQILIVSLIVGAQPIDAQEDELPAEPKMGAPSYQFKENGVTDTFLDLVEMWSSSFNQNVDEDVSPYSDNICEAYDSSIFGKNHCVSIHHTLTYPIDMPEVRFYSKKRYHNTTLKMEILKDDKIYFSREILDPGKQESIKVTLPEQHPSGFFKSNVTLSYRNSGKMLFNENKALFVRDARKVKDLLFFSFSTPEYDEWDLFHFRTIENTPFTGIVTPLIRAFETERVRLQDYRHVVPMARKATPKIWPALFLNRFVGSPESSPYNRRSGYWKSHDFQDSEFAKINLMDFDNRTGALGEFYRLLAVAAQLSMASNSPGIFIDCETYNCRNSIKVRDLARAYNTSKREIIRKLSEIGYQMADIIHANHPKCTVMVYHAGFDWIYRRGIARKEETFLLSRKESDVFHSTSYIFLGMLERARTQQYEISVVDGDIGGYLYPNLEFCKKKILMDYLLAYFCKERYPNHYFFGTTVAPYENFTALKKDNWIRKALTPYEIERKLTIKRINDFEASLKYMFNCSDYVWVYGASAAGDKEGFNLFRISNNDVYTPVFRKAINNTSVE